MQLKLNGSHLKLVAKLITLAEDNEKRYYSLFDEYQQLMFKRNWFQVKFPILVRKNHKVVIGQIQADMWKESLLMLEKLQMVHSLIESCGEVILDSEVDNIKMFMELLTHLKIRAAIKKSRIIQEEPAYIPKESVNVVKSKLENGKENEAILVSTYGKTGWSDYIVNER